MTDWTVATPPPATPDCEPHTPSPPGYLAHAEWMEEMGKTHKVRRCQGCMRFMIWEPATCLRCLDDGHVCEEHPGFPWEGLHGPVEGHAEHGGAGMPCPHCCSPVPEDGSASITEAFVPDWKRGSNGESRVMP